MSKIIGLNENQTKKGIEIRNREKHQLKAFHAPVFICIAQEEDYTFKNQW